MPFDPVTLELLGSRVESVVEECWSALYRGAFSTIVAEACDFGCEVLDPGGGSLGHARRSMPVFNLALPHTVRAMLERHPATTLRPGDVLITNDPWLCAGHLPDVAVVTPVFAGDRLVAFMAAVVNVSDIGGVQDAYSARDLYEEGVRIPPMFLRRAGGPNRDLLELLAANVRLPQTVLGDLDAMVAATAVGASRLLDLAEEAGLPDFSGLGEALRAQAAAAARRAVRQVPDGVYRARIGMDGAVGGPRLELGVAVHVRGEAIEVVYEDVPAQLAGGGRNCVLTYTRAHTAYALKCLLTPEVRSNEGCYAPYAVTAPEGSILNARFPASVDMRQNTGWFLAPLLHRALAPAMPDRVQAPTGLPLGFHAFVTLPDGTLVKDHLFQGGGQGASAGHDGTSTLLYPTSAGNVSVEMFEQRVPLWVEAKEWIPDSGGQGQFRGGLGQRVRVRRLPGHASTVHLGVHPAGMGASPPGLFGGAAGRPTELVRRWGGRVTRLAHGAYVELARDDDYLEIRLGGGGGYGPPEARAPEAVRRDLLDGLTSAEGGGPVVG
jgi:5-oxoprolinase (ATP-hydrolysing)